MRKKSGDVDWMVKVEVEGTGEGMRVEKKNKMGKGIERVDPKIKGWILQCPYSPPFCQSLYGDLLRSAAARYGDESKPRTPADRPQIRPTNRSKDRYLERARSSSLLSALSYFRCGLWTERLADLDPPQAGTGQQNCG